MEALVILKFNVWAVLFATIAVFLLGWLWYSENVFGDIWKQESTLNNEDFAQSEGNTGRHNVWAYIVSFIFSFIAALVFAYYLGPAPALAYATKTGFVVGLCWVATSFGTNYLFTGRNWKLLLIDGGYHVAQFTLYGYILGLWH